MERRAEAGGPEGVEERRAPGGGLPKIRRERGSDVPLEAESRPRAQGPRRDGSSQRLRDAVAGRVSYGMDSQKQKSLSTIRWGSTVLKHYYGYLCLLL